HTLGEQYAKTHNIPSERRVLRETFLTDELLKNSAGDSYFRDFLKRVNSFVVELNDSLPKGLSHLDFDIDNVLTKNDRVTAILDFGDMECLPLVSVWGIRSGMSSSKRVAPLHWWLVTYKNTKKFANSVKAKK